VLTKKDLAELKAYAKPPALVEFTLTGVMTVLKRPATWDEAKKALGDASFMQRLLEYDKDKLTDDSLLKKIGKFTSAPDFTPDAVGEWTPRCQGAVLGCQAAESQVLCCHMDMFWHWCQRSNRCQVTHSAAAP
jgi:dynein heavy chain